uniref:Uncharacterized protein n=1 Tax=Anguilla anguilla TaxID=7936 RepID=A0A0E9WMJ6_ANGAN
MSAHCLLTNEHKLPVFFKFCSFYLTNKGLLKNLRLKKKMSSLCIDVESSSHPSFLFLVLFVCIYNSYSIASDINLSCFHGWIFIKAI